MKALVLCAGLGTRLRPLTLSTPKVLMPLRDKPLLEYHLDALRTADLSEILINSHYLARQVEQFVQAYAKRFPQVNIKVTLEEELLGSAGTLRANRNFFDGDEVLVVYGDGLTNINYLKFINFFRQTKGLGAVAVYHEPNPETKGIVEFSGSQQIIKFVEKPKPEQVTAHYANAGIYLFRPEIFNCLPEVKFLPFDFGHHVFPYLLEQRKQLYAYPMQEFYLDIGTMESYTKAQALAEKLFHPPSYDNR